MDDLLSPPKTPLAPITPRSSLPPDLPSPLDSLVHVAFFLHHITTKDRQDLPDVEESAARAMPDGRHFVVLRLRYTGSSICTFSALVSRMDDGEEYYAAHLHAQPGNDPPWHVETVDGFQGTPYDGPPLGLPTDVVDTDGVRTFVAIGANLHTPLPTAPA